MSRTLPASSSSFSFDRWLAIASIGWMVFLLIFRSLLATTGALAITVGVFLCLNFIVVLLTLITEKRILILLNVVQILLFTFAFYQIAQVFGAKQFRFDEPAKWWHWLEFTLVHVLRAVDVLDFLEEYHIDIQNIRHATPIVGGMIVALHIGVDLFLLGLLASWIRRCWPKRKVQSERGEGRLRWAIRLTSVLVVLVLFGTAISQQWRIIDWGLWPIDQVIRTVDFGDVMNIFHLQFHRVEMNSWTIALALLVRLLVGLWAVRQINRLQVRVLGASALKSLDEWIDALDDPVVGTRQRAAEAVEGMGARSSLALDRLVARLRDPDPHVARAMGSALQAVLDANESIVPRFLKSLENETLCPAILIFLDSWFGSSEAVMTRLISLLEHPNPSIRRMVEVKLTGRYPLRAAHLRPLLDHPNSEMRLTLLRVVAKNASMLDEIAPSLAILWVDPDVRVREAAQAMLETKLGVWARREDVDRERLELIQKLAESLRDSDARIRRSAERAIRVAANGELSVLVDGLLRPDPETRVRTVAALDVIDANWKEHPCVASSISSWLDRFFVGPPGEREMALFALKTVNPCWPASPQALEFLRDVRRWKRVPPGDRVHAIRWLGKVIVEFSKRADAIPALRTVGSWASDSSPKARAEIRRLMEELANVPQSLLAPEAREILSRLS